VIVVDTNILAYLYLPGDFTAHAEALLAKDPEWAAPVLWRSEFRNVLAGYVRRGGLTLNHAQAIQQEAESLMASNEQMVDSVAVLDLVNRSECSAYDCEFIAVAQSLGTKLVTMDGKLLKAFPRTAKPLVGAG
jgi:predicted nucleic acid-binding protein